MSMTPEARLFQSLFQSLADELADELYVIDRENYDLLYANETKPLFLTGAERLGRKCYAALHGKDAPCAFCTLRTHPADGRPHPMAVDGSGRFYSTRFREIDWNGVPAYVKYVRDVTDEVRAQQEKTRLEQYFQTVVRNLNGGVAVMRCDKDGEVVPEYLSEGFAAMTGMEVDQAWRLYQADAMEGVHPDDRGAVEAQLQAFIAGGASRCEQEYRLRTGTGGYIWVKNTLSLIRSEDGELRVYAVYHDMTRERTEKEQLRSQYNELIMQHYRITDPGVLVVGHCNITQNEILEIIDYTDSDMLSAFGSVREEFFTGVAGLVVDEEERRAFKDRYLNAPSLAAFARKQTEVVQTCFIKLPKEERGRYAQFKVNLVETPDTGDVTGILTVTDVTGQTISELILHRLSVSSYDLVMDVDLAADRCSVLSGGGDYESLQGGARHSHSARVAYILGQRVLPKDRDQAARMFDPAYMLPRLEREGAYSFTYSMTGDRGEVLTKKLDVLAIDLRLGRVCLARTDITDSLKEQQGLLNAMAYTFEQLGLIDIATGRMKLYTRQAVLENLPPYEAVDYSAEAGRLAAAYGLGGDEGAELERQLRLETMLRRLEERRGGYDFVTPFRAGESVLYKQVNILWGDEKHQTVCTVRADVTDMLAAERQHKQELEGALALAEEANRAKSDFLSSMSHDIRTPMNAIMGMTTLARAHADNPRRVADCLDKISISSKHLLSLINDILDMSKIEQSKITLNPMRTGLNQLIGQLTAMMAPQARAAGLELDIRTRGVEHPCFCGDALRLNQILINLLSNAIKFTPAGGRVDVTVEELPAHRGPGWVRYRFTVADTGVGMGAEYLSHLFEPFSRSRNTANLEGTGLGLSITKGLVDLMGGEIKVESQLGRGSTFQVELECEQAREEPVGLAERTPEPEPGERARSFAGRRFLVAEDNAINAEILCELLALFGAECSLTRDGDEAVRAFAEARPGVYDAILMDIQMPRVSGYEATRDIRAMTRPDARTIPIVAMTANAFAEDVQASLEAGMTAHVAKPIDVNLLRQTLARVLEGERALLRGL